MRFMIPRHCRQTTSFVDNSIEAGILLGGNGPTLKIIAAHTTDMNLETVTRDVNAKVEEKVEVEAEWCLLMQGHEPAVGPYRAGLEHLSPHSGDCSQRTESWQCRAEAEAEAEPIAGSRFLQSAIGILHCRNTGSRRVHQCRHCIWSGGCCGWSV